jgi:hypothetical protein
MIRILATITLGLLAAAPTLHATLAESLKSFAGYDYGQPKKVLHDTRLAAMKGADQPDVRADHERRLIDFIQSDATLTARREACLWLGSIGTGRCLPVLEKFASDPEMADVADIAARSVRGNAATVAGEAGHSLARFREAVGKSEKPAALLIDGIRGEDPEVARLAFGLAAQGIGTDEVVAWLGGAVAGLPAERRLLALNTLQGIDPAAIGTLAREGDRETRLAAVRQISATGGGQAADFLYQLIGESGSGVTETARVALVIMDEDIVRPYIIVGLRSSDPGTRAKMIEIAVARGAEFAADELWKIAGEDGAAIRALGRIAPVGDFQRMLNAFVAGYGKEQQRDYRVALFEIMRRQPDYDEAIRVIDGARSSAPPEVAKVLGTIAGKLGKLKPTKTLEQVGNQSRQGDRPEGVLLPGAFNDIMPKRFEVAAYLDCGPQTKVRQNGVTIECLNGKAWHSSADVDPALSLSFAESSLDFAINGLTPGTDYILGLTWWDSGLQDRRQSVFINGAEVLPDTRPIAYDENAAHKDPKRRFLGKPTPARIQFALLPEHIADGSMKLNIRKLAGPNVVNSEIWVMKRKQPAAAKQVLLVSGQDYPGHHWRKTGPEVEGIITADPRMEVTICETPYALGLKHLGTYDAVFVHFKNYREFLPSTEAMQAKLESYVRGGGGMCLSHFACGAMEEWPRFVDLSGRVWNGQGHDKRGPFTVKVVDRNHQITRGLADFETDDELYFCLKGSPRIHLLCDAFSKVRKTRQPQAFIVQPDKGRVFLSTLGHDVRAYKSAGARTLYRQATAWAAGLE